MAPSSRLPLASFKALVKQNPVLASEIFRFNTHTASNLHPDRRQTVLSGLSDRIWSAPRLSTRMSKLISGKAHLSESYYLEIPNPIWPVVLLTPERLQRLALHIAALIFGIRIRASLAREHVVGWKRKLGDDAYRFAMNSASLLPAVQVSLPVVASDSALAVGMGVIQAALIVEPKSLQERAVLKLPIGIEPIDLDPDKAKRLLAFVMQTVEGEWYSLCAVLRTSANRSPQKK